MTMQQSWKRLCASLLAVMPDLLAVFILTIVSWNFTSGIAQVLDINLMGDESYYLGLGVSLKANGPPSPAWAPLYAIWYFLLSLLEPDRIKLYYLNYKILTYLPAFFMYLLLRVHRVRPIVGLCAACIMVVCRGNYQTSPKVSHFVLSILLGGLTIGSILTHASLVFGIFSLAGLLASYARPEYFLTFIACAIIACAVMFRRKPESNRVYLMLLVVAAVALSLFLTLGFPLGSESARSRSFLAFKQHISLHLVNWTHSESDPWSEMDEIVRKHLGDSNSAAECALRNPQLIARHVVANILSMPGKAIGLLGCPSRRFGEHLRFSRIAGAYWLFMIAFVIFIAKNAALQTIKANWLASWKTLSGIVIFAVPPLIASTLIWPRDHYLMLSVALLFAALLIVLRKCELPLERGKSFLMLLVGVFFIFQTPILSIPSDELYYKRSIEFLDSLKVRQKARLMAAEYFAFYLSTNWSRVPLGDKMVSFADFLHHNDVSAIMLTDPLARNWRFRSNTQWQEFVANPTNAGFTKLDVPGTPWQLFIRPELLYPQPAADR